MEKLHRSQGDTREAINALRAQDYRKLELISQQYQKEIISYVAEWKYMMSMKNTGNDKDRNDQHGPDYPGNPDEVSINKFLGPLFGWQLKFSCEHYGPEIDPNVFGKQKLRSLVLLKKKYCI